MSYVGLAATTTSRTGVYQESYVSANTPWFFNGIRIQVYTSDKLKIEPWIITDGSRYGMFNEQPGLGLQVLYRRPAPSRYSAIRTSAQTSSVTRALRFHSDDSIQIKYLDDKSSGRLPRGHSSFTFDIGAGTAAAYMRGRERRPDAGVPRRHGLQPPLVRRRQVRHHDGGGAMTNPGRYLVLPGFKVGNTVCQSGRCAIVSEAGARGSDPGLGHGAAADRDGELVVVEPKAVVGPWRENACIGPPFPPAHVTPPPFRTDVERKGECPLETPGFCRRGLIWMLSSCGPKPARVTEDVCAEYELLSIEMRRSDGTGPVDEAGCSLNMPYDCHPLMIHGSILSCFRSCRLNADAVEEPRRVRET